MSQELQASTVVELTPGASIPELRHTFTRASLVRYAGVSGDLNPIHWSDRIAATAGLPGVIAHGMLTAGVAVRAVTEWLGDANRVLDYRLRFARPVVVPDTDEGVELVVTGSVVSVAEATAEVSLEVRCNDERVLSNVVVIVARD